MGLLKEKEEVFEVTLGFKSGRTLVVRCTEFKVEKNGDGLKSMTWTLHKSNAFTQLLNIRLDEIEVITSRQV